LAAFAVDLRALRRHAGSPPYRRLAREAHYCSTTLADAAGGQRLPSLAVTLAFVRACGGDGGVWEARWREVAAALAAPEPPAGCDGAPLDGCRCPYVGLSAYGPGDARWFFGRERWARELVARVRSRRFTALFGASGSGKSSLLRAGLLPGLDADNGSDGAARACGWPVLMFTPGAHPLDECAARLAALTGGSAAALHHQLRDDARTMHLTALQALADRDPDTDLMVVVDQFEEVFTLCPPAECEQFLGVLLSAVSEPNSRVRVVIGVRADFYPACAQYPALVDALRDAQVLLGPMSTEELRQAISGPAAAAGCTVEGALLARVVAEAAGQPGALPLVSHALRQTWRHRRGNTLTIAGYEASGGIHHALARTAETLYAALTEQQQDLTRGILLRLVAVGEDTADTKRPVAREQFPAPSADAVLDALAGARLITLDQGSVELTHEALLSAWPRLRRWIEEDRAGLMIRQRLAEAAAAWQREGRDVGALYRGERLAAATARAERGHGLPLEERSRLFLAASVRHARRTARLRRGAIAALCTLSLLASAAAAGAGIAAHRALRDDATARAATAVAVSRELAAQALNLDATAPFTARQLAVAAWHTSPTNEAAQAESTLLTEQHNTLVLSGGPVTSMAFNPAGTLLAATDGRGTVKLWNPTTQHQVGAISTPAGSIDIAFSPAGTLVTISPQGQVVFNPAGTVATLPPGSLMRVTVQLWDPATGHRVGAITSPGGIGSMAFNPAGTRLAIAGQDGTVTLWDPATAHQVSVIPAADGHDPIVGVAFNPAGILIVAYDSGNVRLWDPATGHQTGARMHTDINFLEQVAFNATGTLMATYTPSDVQIWDPATGHQIAAIPAIAMTDTGGITNMVFNAAGTLLAIAGSTGLVTLWDPASGHRVAAIPATTRPISAGGVAFNTAGTMLAIAADNGAITLWDPATAQRINTALSTPTAGGIEDAAFNAAGTLLATVDGQGRVDLWDPATQELIRTVTEPAVGSLFHRVVFNAAGTLLATADDGSVTLWDPATGHQIRRIITPPYPGGIDDALFNPTGTQLAVLGGAGMVTQWDAATGYQVGATINVTTDPTHNMVEARMVFNPTGTLLAITDPGGSGVTLWDPATGYQVRTLTTDQPMSDAMAFNPTGTLLATSANDQSGTVTLWDPATGHQMRTITTANSAPAGAPGHGAGEVAFNAAGTLLATADAHGMVKLWDPATGLQVGSAITVGYDNITDPVVPGVVFNPIGTMLAAIGQDGASLVDVAWHTNPDRALCREFGLPSTPTWSHYTAGAVAEPGTC
jgi:WD40 repeat protein